ncbi:MAG TPA: C40 family peptidase, partial [Luteimonas sp.]|nr:C40 family peptidase [Luteimonas sp.]
MTTNDPIAGRSAAHRRPLPGFLRFPCSLLVCAALFCAGTPAFAQQATPDAVSTMASASTVAPVSPAVSDALPLPDRAILFAGDINRLIVSQPVTATTAEPASGGRIQTLLKRALALLGTPYRWGGTGTSGFDCSGMVGYVFKTALGIELPRVSREMATSGQLVSDRSDLSPGDLVFFGRRGRVSHVGIYVGEGRFVHAPRTGKTVEVSSLDGGYWGGKFLQARRVAG